MRLLLLLLLVAPAILAFDVLKLDSGKWRIRNGTTEELKNFTVIRDPKKPFARYGVVYYWNGYYKAAPSNPKRCIFLKNHPDWPFGDYFFPNGTIVTGVEFGCGSEHLCKKFRCDKSMATGLVWCAFLIMSSIVSIGIIVRYVISRRNEEIAVNQDMEMRSIYVPVVVVNEPTARQLEVPSMHQE